MVEIFKTNIQRKKLANLIIDRLSSHYPFFKINIDMKDSDRVLRIEGNYISCDEIVKRLQSLNIKCQVLE
jgi:uncharacterized Fe-S cluster-containing protein